MNAIGSLQNFVGKILPWMLSLLSVFLLSCATEPQMQQQVVLECNIPTQDLQPRPVPPRIDAVVGDIFQERDRLRSSFAQCEADKKAVLNVILEEKRKSTQKE